jgi:hypothetical protein
MTRNRKWFSSLTPLSHKKYATFGDDKKGKVLGTGVIKVNDCFTFFLFLSLLMLIWISFFASLIHMFFTLLANLFVVSLALEIFFKLNSHLLNLP